MHTEDRQLQIFEVSIRNGSHQWQLGYLVWSDGGGRDGDSMIGHACRGVGVPD